MGIEVTCDCCCGDMDSDEIICRKCAKKPASGDAALDGEDEISDLAAAIRRGDMVEAEYLLDKVAALVPGWSDRVSLGRYSPQARAAA